MRERFRVENTEELKKEDEKNEKGKRSTRELGLYKHNKAEEKNKRMRWMRRIKKIRMRCMEMRGADEDEMY